MGVSQRRTEPLFRHLGLRRLAGQLDTVAVAAPVRALVEAYPTLKADANFLKLQKALADTEDRIALARGFFNEIAAFWNARIESFPAIVVAALTGMRKRPLMEAAGFERKPVEVRLGA